MDDVEIARAWRVFETSDNKDSTNCIQVTEFRSGEGVTIQVGALDDDDFNRTITLTPAQWRALTQLPVRFEERVKTT